MPIHKIAHKLALTFTMALSGPVFAACVNSLILDAPDERFRLQEGTAIDKRTGLMWLRCALGQQWSDTQNTCTANFDFASKYDWNGALAVANGYTAQGYADWRLPNKNELSSIVDRACSGPAINGKVFTGTLNGGYWTSTPWRREAGKAWHVDFTTGTLIGRESDAQFGVYLVRDQ
ncbi:MAG TPA: DUF1566 domain-containing protein [Marinagarivorans sp.]